MICDDFKKVYTELSSTGIYVYSDISKMTYLGHVEISDLKKTIVKDGKIVGYLQNTMNMGAIMKSTYI